MRHVIPLILVILPSVLFAGGSVESRPGPASEKASQVLPAGSPGQSRGFVPGGIAPIRGFTTDFSRSIVPADEVRAGGPPKDGIPAIDRPAFVQIDDVNWLAANEPVLVVSADGSTHIYPLQILTYHEIVNDTVGETPLAVTYCPLCNTGIVFRRDFDGAVLDFGTTGRLRYSNLLMYDRQTETWWQQATGEAVIGLHAGSRLRLHPVLMLAWEVAADRFADARVLSRETGFARAYGTNPYAGYDSSATPFLYQGPDIGEQYNPMTRVVQVVVAGETLAIAYPVVSEERVVHHDVGGIPVVVFWADGTASALDARSIRDGRDVGSANAFRAEVEGRRLTFAPSATRFVDDQTGSHWDATGRAVDGPLAGAALEPLVGIQHFWFSYSAFESDGVWTPTDVRE